MRRQPAYDVAVVGGGLVGTALAYELVAAGAKAVLVDRRDPGRATDAGAGILSPETSGVEDRVRSDLAVAAGEHHRELVPALEDDGARTTGYAVTGLLRYVGPWPEGRVVVGATMEPDAGFDARPTATGMRQLFSEMLRLAPGLADATFLEVRAGLRPVSADGAPVLGGLPGWENVFVRTGHGAHGLLLGPYSARLVADQVLGRTSATDLAPFSADRFPTP